MKNNWWIVGGIAAFIYWMWSRRFPWSVPNEVTGPFLVHLDRMPGDVALVDVWASASEDGQSITPGTARKWGAVSVFPADVPVRLENYGVVPYLIVQLEVSSAHELIASFAQDMRLRKTVRIV